MLSLFGDSYRHRDGVSRRSWLTAGALTFGGWTLADLLRAEAAGGAGSKRSLIMIFLSGGPPHLDMFDLKPDAPVEIRGEFQSIPSDVPGIDVCEHLPLLAQRMKRCAVIRSVVGAGPRHSAFQCMTGQLETNQPPGGWPSLGSTVSYLQGPRSASVPPFVGLSPRMRNVPWGDPGQSGFLGLRHEPFKPNADGMNNLVLNGSRQKLDTRRELLQQLDQLKRSADATGVMDGMDAFTQQAFEILTSSKLAEALDLEREDPKLRDRYGRGSTEPAGYGDAGPLLNDYFLTARRLVEAGVRVVTLAYGRWDWHGRPHGTTFENARGHLPMLDKGVAALLDDLEERGMADDVGVIIWGEFGRTPRINPNGGRDHWPRVSQAVLAGGGMRTGQIIGSTDRLGESAKDRPIHFQDIFATLYHVLGIDTGTATVPDYHARPRYLVDHNQYHPIRELL